MNSTTCPAHDPPALGCLCDLNSSDTIYLSISGAQRILIYEYIMPYGKLVYSFTLSKPILLYHQLELTALTRLDCADLLLGFDDVAAYRVGDAQILMGKQPRPYRVGKPSTVDQLFRLFDAHAKDTRRTSRISFWRNALVSIGHSVRI